MAFWSTANLGSEPKRAYRWIMEFGIAGLPSYLIKKVSPRPSWSLSEVKHNFLNHTFYYPGRVEYDEISVTIVDALDPDGVGTLQALLFASGYRTPDTANPGGDGNFNTVSKAGWSTANGAQMGDITISQLDSTGGHVNDWHLVNPWIKACKYGDLDYESDDLLNIEVTLRYDYFKLDSNNSGIVQQYEEIAGVVDDLDKLLK